LHHIDLFPACVSCSTFTVKLDRRQAYHELSRIKEGGEREREREREIEENLLRAREKKIKLHIEGKRKKY